MSVKQTWNTELYEARHAFVWQYGETLIELLRPEKGEQVLDLGCGTGQLTNRIAESGAQVTGLDSSPDMIGQARQNYPALRFVLADAGEMQLSSEFDAIFSNAALHWIPNPLRAAAAMARALKPGGRLVAELGGKGNVRRIEERLTAILPRYGKGEPFFKHLYFPSISEYSGVLESAGFEVRLAELFDRSTPLEGDQGMADWLRQFSWYNFEPIPADTREKALADLVEALRPALYHEGRWFADYRRLRIVALKL